MTVVSENLLRPGRIGNRAIGNRIIRAATSESLALPDGRVDAGYVEFYRKLARGGAGLIFTGHLYVEPRGQYEERQAGIHDDRMLPGLKHFTQIMRDEGATVFAELGHAGSQSKVAGHRPIAPSPVRNFISGREPQEASEADISEIIGAYGRAAYRAMEAGFAGIHLHGGHGYLISEFNSPYTNRRDDDWGGTADKRSRFLLAVYDAVRRAVGPDCPVTVKLGMADSMTGGLEPAESVDRAAALESRRADAIEVSVGIMHVTTNSSTGRFVGVTPRRALQDLVVHRLFYPAAPEAYFLPHAQAVKRRLARTPVILGGGLRTIERMESILASGAADFISLARPMIREPDIPNQIANGRTGLVDCVSCNMCSAHEGRDPTQCWRSSIPKILAHVGFRLRRNRRSPPS